MTNKCITDRYGNKYWLNENDQYHREDGPAIIWNDGGEEWWQNEQLHRIDGPAVVLLNNKRYFLFGKEYFSEKEYQAAANVLKWSIEISKANND